MPILFTAHSIPASIMWGGDAYPFEIGSTVYAIMKHFQNPYRINCNGNAGVRGLGWIRILQIQAKQPC